LERPQEARRGAGGTLKVTGVTPRVLLRVSGGLEVIFRNANLESGMKFFQFIAFATIAAAGQQTVNWLPGDEFEPIRLQGNAVH
jgi:hypothetical protein